MGASLPQEGGPSLNAFPDFASPKVRDWWGGLLKEQLDEGVAGYLTDMNEPTVVGSGSTRASTFPMDAVHDTDIGPRSHAEIHNVYGMLETMATREGMLRARPDERPFIITRSTYAGGQRYCGAVEWRQLRHLGPPAAEHADAERHGAVGSAIRRRRHRRHHAGAQSRSCTRAGCRPGC